MGQSIIDDIDASYASNAIIKVIGVGGGGGNAIQEMINADLAGVHFICANTDMQALSRNPAKTKIQLGEKLTRGLGAGAKPSVGRESAMESINTIRDAIGDANMVFITAGMGGGTGTGAAPVIAQVAKEAGALTVGVVTKPFTMEATSKMKIAESGIEELKKHVDCLIVIPNDRLYCIAPKKTPIKQMFQKANEVLLQGVRSISNVITHEGYINVDFADVQTTMSQSGLALMGTGRASGENRAHEATQMAIESPLLENVSLESAKAILYNVTTSENNGLTMEEINEIGSMIKDSAADPDINIIWGFETDDSIGDALQITVIATGIEPMEEVEEPMTGMATVTAFSKSKPMNQQSGYRIKNQQQIRQEAEEIEEPIKQNTVNKRSMSYDDNIPRSTYIPRQSPLIKKPQHHPGQDSYSYDNENLELPAFLRKTAD